ncbi:unnamed protein product [Cyprideis torosa]|uniref:ABC3 transporter permease C-terminal domain-containing protein n=1 Tax=Cyprideis torosa TaxID=163714 RepID=A0A7R8WVM2_9CRUS|nr:unnamed protein product [Cyprideis torosa]CAG0907719.1 unnamed protein product [Cyprideis torosa]
MKRLTQLPFRISMAIAVSEDLANGIANLGDRASILTLKQAGYDVDPESHVLEPSAKRRWIVVLSLLVCTVGIINAQLMSITERFREIGTMKCLGALDSFVVKIFLIEAGLQGFVGASAGAFIGAFTALALMILRFGLHPFALLDYSPVILSACLAIFMGTVLSLAGALYPALLAARMQPVEAMRAEY